MTDSELPLPASETFVGKEYRAEIISPPGDSVTLYDPDNPYASIYADNAVDISDYE